MSGRENLKTAEAIVQEGLDVSTFESVKVLADERVDSTHERAIVGMRSKKQLLVNTDIRRSADDACDASAVLLNLVKRCERALREAQLVV